MPDSGVAIRTSVGRSGGSPPVLLDVESLSVDFWTPANEWIRVVDDVSFRVARGQRVALVGESGAGKTMVGLSMLDLIPTGGRLSGRSISFGGSELLDAGANGMRALRGVRIGMVFQDPMRSLNPVMSIGDQIAESIRTHWRWSRKRALERAVELLDSVGIAAAATRVREYPHQLSGGMRQRAMIALALACDPDLLIADEPTTALDVTVQAQILDLFKELAIERDLAILFITHDLGVVAELCDEVLIMYAGQIVETGAVSAIFGSPKNPYTAGLLRSLPRVGRSARELPYIRGNPPPAGLHVEGCRFANRCDYSEGICSDTAPLLRELESRRVRCHFADDLALEGVRG